MRFMLRLIRLCMMRRWKMRRIMGWSGLLLGRTRRQKMGMKLIRRSLMLRKLLPPLPRMVRRSTFLNQRRKTKLENSSNEWRMVHSIDDMVLMTGDKDAVAVWERFRNFSIDRYVDTYKRLNITYDVYSGESQVRPESIAHASTVLEERGLLVQDKGATLINLEKFKLAKPLIKKRDGTSLYLTRDIGAAKQRYDEYKFDKMVYVVASQQNLHLKQLFKILELMGYEWASPCQPVNFGMVSTPPPSPQQFPY